MTSSQPSHDHVWKQEGVAEKYREAEAAARPFCKVMAAKSGLKDLTSDAYVFDLATGTGAAIQEVYDAVPKEKWGHLKVLGGDISDDMLAYLKKRGETEGWTGLETRIVDGNKMDLPKDTFTHIFCSYAIFQLHGALPKLYEFTKPGGFIAISAHAGLPWLPMLDRAISRVPGKPHSPSEKEIMDKMYWGNQWYEKEYVSKQLFDAGFTNVESVREKFTAPGSSPEGFVEVMQFPMKIIKTFWPEDKQEEYLAKVNENLLEEAKKHPSNDVGRLLFEFDANIGYGYKST